MGRITFALTTSSILAVVALAACVGDDPSVSSNDFDSGSGDFEGGSSSGSSGATCAGNTVDACGSACTKCVAPTGGTVDCVDGACKATCPGTQTACGTACVDLQMSADNCGACGHSCGAGQCSTGLCQPFTAASGFTAVHTISPLADGIVISADTDITVCSKAEGCTTAQLQTVKAGVSQLNDITVAGTDVYYRANMGDFEIVYRCPTTGCPAGGPIQVENIVNDTLARVVAGPTDVLWTRSGFNGPYVNRCALPACASPITVRAKGTGDYSTVPAREQTLPTKVTSVGAKSTLWGTGGLFNDNTKNLRACSITACGTPTEIPGDGSVVALTYFNGLHYGVTTDGFAAGSTVFSVSDATPTTTTPLASDAQGVTDLAVDASGIYWVNGTTGKVLRCKALAGCTSPETLATGQTGATHIRLDSKFAYWSLTTSVMKIAK